MRFLVSLSLKRMRLQGEYDWLKRQIEAIRFYRNKADAPSLPHLSKPITIRRSNLRPGKLVFETLDEVQQYLYDLDAAIEAIATLQRVSEPPEPSSSPSQQAPAKQRRRAA